MLQPLQLSSTDLERADQYSLLMARLELLLEGMSHHLTFAPIPCCAAAKLLFDEDPELLSNEFARAAGEDDWVACMSTVSCELHHAFDYFHWTVGLCAGWAVMAVSVYASWGGRAPVLHPGSPCPCCIGAATGAAAPGVGHRTRCVPAPPCLAAGSKKPSPSPALGAKHCRCTFVTPVP
jgi:hypothetical protein